MNILRRIQIVRKCINFLYNFSKKDKLALDEILADSRNLELAGGSLQVPENVFEYISDNIPNQNVSGYTTSCTAQGTVGGANTIRKAKADKTRYSGFVLRDGMVIDGTGINGVGAYVIDAIKKALSLQYINGYYQITRSDFINKIRYALYYNTSTVVTGTNKIDWTLLRQTGYVVSMASSGSGHCFYITGFDDVNKRFICYNSYGKEYGDEGKFYIPYDLADSILFNSTYGLVINPEWSMNIQSLVNFNLIQN